MCSVLLIVVFFNCVCIVFQAGGVLFAIHKPLILFGIKKNCLISGKSLLLYQFTKRVTKLTNNYRGISLLSTSCNISSNILLSRLSPYVDEIIGDHQRGFPRNRSTTDKIFCICQILEKNWEYNETLHQLFLDFNKAYDSVRREVLYNIFIEAI
jgi:hypothetical protein